MTSSKMVLKYISVSRSGLKALILGILTLSSVACGRPQSILDVDSEFAPYVTRFEQTAEIQGVSLRVDNLRLQFGDLPNPRENGVCELSSSTTPTITIRKDVWDKMTDADREELVFHEMGHCVLGRTHKAEKNSQGIPESMMNPYRIVSAIYEEHRNDYIVELFHPDHVTTLAAQ